MGCNQSKHVVRGAIAFEDDDDHDEALLVRRRSRAKNVHLDVAQAPHGQEKALKLPLRLRDGNSTSSGSNNSSRNNVKSPSHGASRTPAMTPHGDDDSNEVTPPPNRSPILNLILRSQSHPNGSSRSTSEDGPSLHPSASMMHQDTRHIPGSYASAVMSSMGDQNLANGKSSDVVAGGEGLDASLGGDVGAAVSKSMSAVLDSMTGRGPGTERKSSGAGLLAGDIGFKDEEPRRPKARASREEEQELAQLPSSSRPTPPLQQRKPVFNTASVSVTVTPTVTDAPARSEAPLARGEVPIPVEFQLFLENHRPSHEASIMPQNDHERGEGATITSTSTFCTDDGMAYDGHLRTRDGKPHGWGRATLEHDSSYEGYWSDGKPHGKGALLLGNGNAYWGSWALGRKHGVGSFLWADNSRHDGMYAAGMRSGAGTLLYASGAMYEGEFEDNARHGVGRLELPGGASYDGQWAHDVPHGFGVFVDEACGGERFEGRWERGMRSGGGRLVEGWAASGADTDENDGDEVEAKEERKPEEAWYTGNFVNGLPHGEGAMGYGSVTFYGHVERGMWTGGGGTLDLGEGQGRFEGSWSHGLPRGRGRWTCQKSGIEVDCTFEEGFATQNHGTPK